jgi:hypothetical protein
MVAFSKLPVMLSDEDVLDKRYENGKIYLAKCKNNPNLVYVGSTHMSLEERFNRHKKDKKCSLYKYVDGDWDNWYIELYEDYPCKNKYILELRETEVQKQIATINKQLARRTKKQYHQDNRDKILENMKQYRQDNRDKLLENMKQRYQANRDKLLEYQKQYRQDNRDKIKEQKKQNYQDNRDELLEYQKQYNKDNRDKIKEQRKQKTTCDRCGCIVTKHIKRHQKTKKCLNYNVANN